MARPTKALLDISALRHNYRYAQRLSDKGRAIPIIKANAYGHGAVAVASALADLAPAFGVACIEEALELRNAGINQPILLLEGAFTADEVMTASEQNFWLMSSCRQQIDAIVAAPLKQELTVWLKADTGMHRLGLAANEFATCYERLIHCPFVANDAIVVATHFSSADDLSDNTTELQIAHLLELTQDLNVELSMANSPALLAWPEARGQWNRPGFMLYGNSPLMTEHDAVLPLKPVMTLRSAIIALREVDRGESVGYGRTWVAPKRSKIATVAIGYGDGYPRHAISGTPVWIKDQRAELVGRVSMDMLSIDVSHIENVAIGDEVELWGTNICVNEVASYAGTIGYELLARMPMRTPRIVVD
ncbi:alanine racemase [Sinobacterium caligoides]|uniref:Alanine racemase n=1 Tax=Sinobacterium caligoides TaxID=933926 RepID=A0A3N2DZ69_9GAMM|nr:alanine racemase [Sinobacterium caligoides]ROS04585.1 alanine racemase [Sinobacterium caligoides]